MESESFLTPQKLFHSALARTSSRTSMASSPSLMAVPTPTSLSRNSTTSSVNSTSNRFNLLPVLQTPPSRIFKGRIVNPFEPHLVERLHLPIIGSPSLFHRPCTPQNSSITQFEWTIDEVASLGSVNVEPHETQFHETPDPANEARVQAAISSYFKEHSIVPSPIDCQLRNQKIIIPTEGISTSSPANRPSHGRRKVRNGICQTVLTFPPQLPKEIEDVLQKYLTFNEDQQQKRRLVLDESAGSSIDHDARDASLRRKLFNTSGVNDDTDSGGDGTSRFGNSIDDLELKALSPAPQSPEVLVRQEEVAEQDLKRSRYYGSQEALSHVLESDCDSSFGALSPISKTSQSPSASEVDYQHSDVDAIYRSTPEPSTLFQNSDLSLDLDENREITSGSIKHTELTNEMADTNLTNDDEKSLMLSLISSDCSQRSQHSTTPLGRSRRTEHRRTNRRNLSQSFLHISDNDCIERIAHCDSACEMSITKKTPLKALSPIKEIVGISENLLKGVNFYRTDSGFNEESQSNDFTADLSDVSMLSEEFSITPGRRNKDVIAISFRTNSSSALRL